MVVVFIFKCFKCKLKLFWSILLLKIFDLNIEWLDYMFFKWRRVFISFFFISYGLCKLRGV